MNELAPALALLVVADEGRGGGDGFSDFSLGGTKGEVGSILTLVNGVVGVGWSGNLCSR